MALWREREYWVTHAELGLETGRGLRVLEIGCGAGVWTANLARLGVQVYHFDLATTLVERARQAAAPYPTQGLVADMHRLPFPNASFDAVFGSMVLHHTDRHQEFGQEVARVLRAEGRAVFHENSARNPLLYFLRAV